MRGVFEASDQRMNRLVRRPQLRDVEQALSTCSYFVTDDDKRSFCCSLGIDYDRASEYLEVIQKMERAYEKSADDSMHKHKMRIASFVSNVQFTGKLIAFFVQLVLC